MATATEMQKNNHPVARVQRTQPTAAITPRVDIVETTDELTLMADVPGIDSTDIDIQYEQGELTIRARSKQENGNHGGELLSEFAPAEYFRAFQLGEGLDSENIRAEVANGVLTVHLPKFERIKPRKIAVQSAP